MKTEIVKFESSELNGIEKSKAEKIKRTFEPMAEMLSQFEDAYNSVIKEAEKGIDKEVTKTAKRVRIDIGKVRIETEKLRKAEKEEYLRAGKAIDGVSNILKWAVTDKENKLKEIEDYFEIQEQKRLEKLQSEREELLSKYVEDAHERDLSGMDEDVWSAYIATKKKEYNDRIEAEKQAEKERKEREEAERKEQERIRKENEKLKKEREEAERKAKIEADKRAKEERERKAKEEKERKERENKERKEREAYEAKLKKEREERERMQREIEKQKEAERKAKEEEEKRKQAELSKDDTAKVKDLIAEFEALKTKYAFKSEKNKKMYKDVSSLIDKIISHIQK